MVSNSFFVKVANSVGSTYFQLGILLGITKPLLERLEVDFVGKCWRITFEMLCKWRQISPRRTNIDDMVEELTTALSSIEMNDVVNMVIHGKCASVRPGHCLLTTINNKLIITGLFLTFISAFNLLWIWGHIRIKRGHYQ